MEFLWLVFFLPFGKLLLLSLLLFKLMLLLGGLNLSLFLSLLLSDLHVLLNFDLIFDLEGSFVNVIVPSLGMVMIVVLINANYNIIIIVLVRDDLGLSLDPGLIILIVSLSFSLSLNVNWLKILWDIVSIVLMVSNLDKSVGTDAVWDSNTSVLNIVALVIFMVEAIVVTIWAQFSIGEWLMIVSDSS